MCNSDSIAKNISQIGKNRKCTQLPFLSQPLYYGSAPTPPLITIFENLHLPHLRMEQFKTIMIVCLHYVKKTGRKVLLLLRLYLLGSLSVTLTVLLFWIYFFSSDASICSTMAFPPLRNTDHCCLSFIDFPSNSNWMPRFIAQLITVLVLSGTVVVII